MKTIVVFDLEATCWEQQQFTEKKGNEIIEIGAVRINKDFGEIINEFNIFVKPVVNPKLTQYCINLTSIEQKDVDASIEFAPAMDAFNDWLNLSDDDYIMSWGYYDRNQIQRESLLKNYNGNILHKLESKHLNMKNQFAHIRKINGCGMSKALKMVNLKLEGTHHRGIDDAKNMVRIYMKMKDIFFNKIY
jgi:inhibitor of KinA sporulation pathway (predicted exonuclease)